MTEAPRRRPGPNRRFKSMIKRCIPSSLALPILAGNLKGLRWIVKSSDFSCFLGSYETHVQRAIVEYVGPGAVAYDIGANVGFHTLLCAKAVGAKGKVFAFEPFPRNQNILKRHLQLNGIGNVTVVEAAVSDRRGSAWFTSPVDNHGSMGHLSEHESADTISIESIALDGTDYPLPDFIKMDVEGAELLALRGMHAILSRSKPVLVIERTPSSWVEVEDLLTQSGYRSRPLHGDTRSHAGDWLSINGSTAEWGNY